MKLEVGNLVFSVETVVRDPTPEEREVADLNREATRHKQAKDWDAAIACLQRAQALMRTHQLSNTVEIWLRLPLFLQQAGYFEESMAEFNALLSDAKPLIARDYAHATANVRRSLLSTHLARIHDKMRVACKRQKLFEAAARHERLAEQQWAIHAKLRPLIDAERKKKYQAHREKMEAMQAARKRVG
ncbi:MAG: hypothetical protein Q8O33_00565 [Pseudomonadota bacterium]|nr:hypothetical protein [Pseudomonadota bacterium]